MITKHQNLQACGALLFGGLLLCAASCTTSLRQASQCSVGRLEGSWHLVMADPESVQVLTGLVEFSGPNGRTNLVAKSREGTGEIIDYPVEGLVVRPDSLSFTFAPIRYELRGQCLSVDSLGGEYSVRLFQDTTLVRGTWIMTRMAAR